MSQGSSPASRHDHDADKNVTAPARRRIPFQNFVPWTDVQISRHHLPHWTQPGATYFVTFRLADSIPLQLRQQWIEERKQWLRWHPEPWPPEVEAEYHERFTEQQEQWLDAGMGQCHLRRPALRRLLETCLTRFDAVRCDMDAYVLMPNHVHVLVVPREGYALFELLKGIKGASARGCNQLLGRVNQPFWMEDNHNRIVRTAKELEAFRRYIAENPGKAKLRPDEYTLVLNQILEVAW